MENLTTAVLLLVKSAVKKKLSRNAGMNRMVSALSVITNQPQSINSVKFALRKQAKGTQKGVQK
nr:MAG TPA: hypothetical protein [Caudoviricetes sp.]